MDDESFDDSELSAHGSMGDRVCEGVTVAAKPAAKPKQFSNSVLNLEAVLGGTCCLKPFSVGKEVSPWFPS